ncbi:SoxY-related AACIE arm protein [Inquilinus limosus]|uniref:SoxY-related AACIE arm protein n=1 Tax=Inquilinus limosus TaxID=171674 RepID=UPI0012DF47CC
MADFRIKPIHPGNKSPPSPCGRGAGGGVCARPRANAQGIELAARAEWPQSGPEANRETPLPLSPSREGRGDSLTLARRGLLAAGAGLAVLVLAPRPARARPSLEEAIRGFAGEAEIRPGRVRFDIPPLVENGNAVGVTVAVDSPMTEADHVRRIALFNEKNPQADIAIFHLGPRSGRASVSTRIRLATSQTVVALAEMSDGSVWSAEAEVIVTLAACIEDLS